MLTKCEECQVPLIGVKEQRKGVCAKCSSEFQQYVLAILVGGGVFYLIARLTGLTP